MAQVSEYPSLSIIVPVLNMGRTIRATMDSLVNLDYPKNIIPVALVEQEGKGLNAARNTGIKYSSGEILAYTDGDCVVPSDWAKKIVINFLDPSIGFVGGPMEGYDQKNIFSNYMDESLFPSKPGFRIRVETTGLRLMEFPAGANMAFRRRALARVKFFDENITYGFDDIQPVEAMGFKGFRLVLDPEVSILHKHRSTLKDLLKQHFNYGRGGSLLIIHKRASILASWFAAYLISSLALISVFSFLIYIGFKINHPLPFNLAYGVVGIYWAFNTMYYLPVSIQTGKLWKIIAYPVLDILRGIAFTFGGLYQMIQSLVMKVRK
jgi:glycosyltransferase involved in cell wall biosynthesis